MRLGWKDKRDVYMISTCIADNISNAKRKGKVDRVPEIIETYNSKMRGVYKSDRMLTSYKLERKRLKKWYKKEFLHLLNCFAINSYIIHQEVGGKFSKQMLFWKELTVQIIE